MSRLHLALFAILAAAVPALAQPPIVGAIRWDAWHGELGEPGRAVELALTPPEYHHRLPWFSELSDEGIPTIRCDRPGVMDREIEYALQAGLDYWAFVTYPEDSPLSIPLHQYLAGDWERAPKFCNILEWGRLGGPEGYGPVVDRMLSYFEDLRYQCVLGDRPLFYLLCHGREPVLAQWGSIEAISTFVEALREGARERGVGDPYVVVTWFHAHEAESIRAAIGGDALSVYAVPGGTPDGAPFEASQAQARGYWDAMAGYGPMAPIVSWGWDQRPRVDCPPPWVPNPTPEHYEMFTPEQCAKAVADALDWMAENPEACPAGAILCYAWNEHDEGGWLCPTLGEDGNPDDSRVRAVGELLRQRPR